MPNIAEQDNICNIATKDPKLYESIMGIASSMIQGFDLKDCRDLLEAKGFNISHESIVYKAAQILVRSKLLKKNYSSEKKRVIYQLALEPSISLI